MHIIGFVSFQQYQVDVFFRQFWRDSRLAYNATKRNITLNYNMYDDLWVPDTFFLNSKDGDLHVITVPNRLIQVTPRGDVTVSLRYVLRCFASIIQILTHQHKSRGMDITARIAPI